MLHIKQFVIQQKGVIEIQKHIGKQIHSISNLTKRRIDESESLQYVHRLTGTNGWIIAYLARNLERDIFQKDIEKEFTITRSTASRVISLMVEKGLVERRSMDYDARLKKLQLTEEALEINEHIREHILSVEETMTKGFSQEEIDQLMGYLERVKKNLLDP